MRSALVRGAVEEAANLLGRPYRVRGTVGTGQRRGQTLGFPTANLETPPHTATPADGVYAGWLTSLDLDGAEVGRWPAAIATEIGRPVDYRPVATDGAARAASLLAGLL